MIIVRVVFMHATLPFYLNSHESLLIENIFIVQEKERRHDFVYMV